MPSVTTATLVARAKALADIRDGFVTDAQWGYWMTQERLGLDVFLARVGWPLPLSEVDITVTGSEDGVYAMDLPDADPGVQAVVCIHQVDSRGMRLLRHENAVDFLRQSPGDPITPTGYARTYRVLWTGDTVSFNFFPEPKAGEVYRVTYLAQGLELVTADPTVTATATLTNSNVVVGALDPGRDGNGTVVTLSFTTGVGGTLTINPEVGVTESFNLAAGAIWTTVYGHLDSSAYIEVLTQAQAGASGVTTGQSGTGTTAGGLDADADFGQSVTVHYPMGWEERIVLGMARRALIKEESDTRAIDQEIGMLDQRIDEAAWSRVLSDVPSVRNSDQSKYGWSDRMSIPPYTLWTWI